MALSYTANPRCEVIFAGWRSDTYTLGRHGWKVSVSRSSYDGKWELLLYLESCDFSMHGVSDADFSRYSIYDREAWRNEAPAVFIIRKAFSKWHHRTISDAPFPFEYWNQTRPVHATLKENEVEMHNTSLFLRTDEAAAKEIIVEPQEVSQILEQIMRMQSPRQAEIRKKRVNETATAQATILSFGT